jgi:hypothetical protein
MTLDFAIGAALAALLILGGQWCADARRRRLERDRLARAKAISASNRSRP